MLNEIALPEAPIAAAEDFLQKGGLHQVANGSIFVTCFSEAADIELMWAHYADHFRGAVIEFKIPLVENDDCIFDRCKLKAVDYSPTRPNISSIDNSIKENLRYYKSPCWAYEKEWRIILSDSKETNNHIDHQFYPHKIKTVIVSEKATKEHKLSIENKIQELNNQLNLSIGLKEAKRHPTDYKIIIA